MIVIKGTFRIKAGTMDKAIAAANDVSKASEAEAGCQSYRFGVDTRDGDVLHLAEVWESEEALTAHFGAPHFATFVGQMPELIDGAPEVMRYDVEKSGPLM